MTIDPLVYPSQEPKSHLIFSPMQPAAKLNWLYTQIYPFFFSTYTDTLFLPGEMVNASIFPYSKHLPSALLSE